MNKFGGSTWIKKKNKKIIYGAEDTFKKEKKKKKVFRSRQVPKTKVLKKFTAFGGLKKRFYWSGAVSHKNRPS